MCDYIIYIERDERTGRRREREKKRNENELKYAILKERALPNKV